MVHGLERPNAKEGRENDERKSWKLLEERTEQ